MGELFGWVVLVEDGKPGRGDSQCRRRKMQETHNAWEPRNSLSGRK